MISARFRATKPEDVGIDSEKLEAVFARAKRDVDEGVLPSAQVAVARNGKVAGLRTFGAATDDSLYCIFSCTKAVVAAATWLLFEDGLLNLDERVADIVPEFGTNGKDVITIEQLMLHTGGFPYAPFRTADWDSREKLLEAFGRWRLNWEPGIIRVPRDFAHWVLSKSFSGGRVWTSAT
jgi:CubicO group peptidase (beta-lactamase class C family)